MSATIRIDPQELTAAAAVLRACASEAADVGTGLASCVSCPMPPDVAGLVTGIVSAVGAICDHLALQLDHDAIELTHRAAVAALDIANPGSITSAAVTSTMTIGGAGPGWSITNADGSPADLSSLYPSSATIGGSSGPSWWMTDASGAVVDPSTVLPTAATLGGDAAQVTWIDASGAAVDVSSLLAPTTLGPVGGGGSPGGMSLFNDMNASIIDSTLKPSRSEMESRLGHSLSLSEYHQRVPGGFDGHIRAIDPLAGLRALGIRI